MTTSRTSSLPASNSTFSPRGLHKAILLLLLILLLLFICIFDPLLDFFLLFICALGVRPAQVFLKTESEFVRQFFSIYWKIKYTFFFLPFKHWKEHEPKGKKGTFASVWWSVQPLFTVLLQRWCLHSCNGAWRLVGVQMKAVERIRYWLGPDIQQKSSENVNILTIDHVYALKI